MAGKTDLTALSEAMQAVASPFRAYLRELHDRYLACAEGSVADYIPELAKADPDWFGICVAGADGRVYKVGDSQRPFTLQSISKALVYGLALEDHGRDTVLGRIGVEPSGEAFNAIVLDERTNRPFNPMVNAGAIATTDLVKGDGATERLQRILETVGRYVGHAVHVDLPVALSEKATGSRNRAIAYLMHNFGRVSDHIEETLDLYFQQCGISVTGQDLAVMGATLANGGVNPITGERAIDQRFVQDVLSVMHACGMYDYSGEWSYRVGLPAKSGVGGGIVAVAPGRLGIGVYSPRLDANGNSARGIKVCEELSREFGLHPFNAARPPRDLNAWMDGQNSGGDYLHRGCPE